ncbi:unnamed protein product, partial [Amoebophrya sp. A120]
SALFILGCAALHGRGRSPRDLRTGGSFGPPATARRRLAARWCHVFARCRCGRGLRGLRRRQLIFVPWPRGQPAE